jgi:hypothetical protein
MIAEPAIIEGFIRVKGTRPLFGLHFALALKLSLGKGIVLDTSVATRL